MGRLRVPVWLGGEPRLSRVAVLPYVNQSGDAGQDYVADGITEMLVTNLSSLSSLHVTSATTMRRYRTGTTAVPDIARELGLDALVEGTMAREGDRVRLTVRLIDTASDRALFSQEYRRTVIDVLALQGEVARTVAETVAGAIDPEERQRLATKPPANQAAQEAYLQGLRALAGPLRQDAESARELLESAVALDPGYALAHTALADAYIRLANTSRILPRDESVARATRAAERALELNPTLAGAHAALGRVRFYFNWDWAGAGAALRRAVELSPNLAAAHSALAYYLAATRQLDDALDHARRARELEPGEAVHTTSLAAILYYAGRHADAIGELLAARAARPDFVTADFGLGRVYSALGRQPDAIVSLERSLLAGREVGRVAELARVYAEAGARADALRLLEEIDVITRRTAARLSPDTRASVYAALGDLDQAFTLLDDAVRDRSSGLLWLDVDPRLDRLRADPRFADLRARVGLAR
jgi:TolB-like protein/tetratricopeptide (TPR) repeat protein